LSRTSADWRMVRGEVANHRRDRGSATPGPRAARRCDRLVRAARGQRRAARLCARGGADRHRGRGTAAALPCAVHRAVPAHSRFRMRGRRVPGRQHAGRGGLCLRLLDRVVHASSRPGRGLESQGPVSGWRHVAGETIGCTARPGRTGRSIRCWISASTASLVLRRQPATARRRNAAASRRPDRRFQYGHTVPTSGCLRRPQAGANAGGLARAPVCAAGTR